MTGKLAEISDNSLTFETPIFQAENVSLPDEMALHIFSYAHTLDNFSQISLVSRRWNALSHDKHIITQLIRNNFPVNEKTKYTKSVLLLNCIAAKEERLQQERFQQNIEFNIKYRNPSIKSYSAGVNLAQLSFDKELELIRATSESGTVFTWKLGQKAVGPIESVNPMLVQKDAPRIKRRMMRSEWKISLNTVDLIVRNVHKPLYTMVYVVHDYGQIVAVKKHKELEPSDCGPVLAKPIFYRGRLIVLMEDMLSGTDKIVVHDYSKTAIQLGKMVKTIFWSIVGLDKS